MPPLVAIIMRAKNEMPHARAALEMLDRQTFKNFELFAVDSGSTDGTLDVLRAHCAPDHLTEISPADYIPGTVLNNAIARTRHDIIVFQNADAIPLSETWLEELVRPVLDGQADASMSWQGARPDAHFVVAYDYHRAYDPKNIKNENADFFSAVACAFKRELWEQHKFRTHGYAEDVAWAADCRKSGARFQLVQASQVEHSHNYTLKGLARKKFRHGVTFAEIYGQRPNLGNQIYRCARELIRDFLFACRKLQPQTMPYNMVYRITIHTALHKGLKKGAK